LVSSFAKSPCCSRYTTTNSYTNSANQFSSCIVIVANGLVSLHQQWLIVVSLSWSCMSWRQRVKH
jgi:hypothetical protein